MVDRFDSSNEQQEALVLLGLGLNSLMRSCSKAQGGQQHQLQSPMKSNDVYMSYSLNSSIPCKSPYNTPLLPYIESLHTPR